MNRQTYRALLHGSALFVFCASSAIAAQEMTTEKERALQAEALATATSIQEVGGPLDEPGVSSASKGSLFRLPKIQLQAEDGNATAIVATGFDRVRSRQTDNGTIVSRTRFDLKANIPFQGVEGRDGFFDFKGTEGGESITVGFNFLQTKAGANLSDVLKQQRVKARNMCISKASEAWALNNWTAFTSLEEAKKLANAYTSEAERYFSSEGVGTAAFTGALAAWASENGEPSKALNATVAGTCTGSDTKLIETYLNEDVATSYKRAFFGNEQRLIWNVGAEATATFSDADFLDRGLFSIVEDTKTEWDVTAYIGASSIDGNTSFKLSGSYASTLDFPDEVEVCQPNMDGSQDCLTAPDGPPVLEKDAFVSATLRHRLSKNGVAKNFAIAPVVTYNVDEDEWFFELPIFLQTNDKGALDAGVRLGYDTGEEGFGAGVFIGIPF